MSAAAQVAQKIEVAVRVRPRNPAEVLSQDKDVIVCDDKKITVEERHTFTFSNVFGPNCSQNDLYQLFVMPFVQNIFDGINLTILAYGQTSSGKTFTMVGDVTSGAASDHGVVMKIIDAIFRKLLMNPQIKISVSFLELYKNEMKDLLLGSSVTSGSNNLLAIREGDDGKTVVRGLSEHKVLTAAQAISYFKKGNNLRKSDATKMNQASSRSHSIFYINLSCSVFSSKVTLVDLAGSERVAKTGNSGAKLKEGADINLGLLALGNVVAALSANPQPKFIPYRDSLLTRLLKTSLGGNAKTLFIICVSPVKSNMHESLCTLRYGIRAMKIKNKPVVNRGHQLNEATQQQPLQTQQDQEMEELRRQVNTLKNRLHEESQKNATMRAVEEENKNLRKELQRLRSREEPADTRQMDSDEEAASAEIEPEMPAAKKPTKQLNKGCSANDFQRKPLRLRLSDMDDSSAGEDDVREKPNPEPKENVEPCHCRGACATNKCVCRRNLINCSEDCQCSQTKCKNKAFLEQGPGGSQNA